MSIDKTIQGLQHCFNAKCEGCPYGDTESGHYACKKHEMLADALELLKARQWVSVKDRLPEVGVDVLTVSKDEYASYYMVDSIVNGDWWLQAGEEGTPVTHWMPLPEPPKEGDVDENA